MSKTKGAATMHRVTFDVHYLDGPLAGLTIPEQRVTFPSRELADKHARFLGRVRDCGDFVRAAITGRRFRVVGRVNVETV